MQKIFKALSALLTYPTTELQQAMGEIGAAIERETAIPFSVRDRLHRLVTELSTGDIYDLQERYVLLFDRTRSLSLHLFEHVHGESRDRGQAMIDLKEMYANKGLEIGAAELPDFLPMFIEFLSLLPTGESTELLGQPAHILSALAERLRKRKSAYEAVFRALIALSKAQPRPDDIAKLMNEPDPEPDDLKALDEAWEDEPVNFGPGAADSCKDGLVARIRAGRRPAPGLEIPAQRPVLPRH